MQPNSTAFVAVVAVAAVAAVVGVPLLWDTGRARRAVRSGAVLLATVLTATTLAAVVNKLGDFFPTWSSLTGGDGSGLTAGDGLIDSDLTAAPGRLDAQLAKLARAEPPGHGVLVAVRIGGERSHISRTAAVYVPAAYTEPAYEGYSFPVLEFLGGSPSNPAAILNALNLRTALDQAIDRGLIPPVVVVIPRTNDTVYRDQECVNAVRGAQDDTYLTADLREVVQRELRVRMDRAGWALMGASTGGYCAVNLALRHPGWYAAAVSLSGYFTAITDPTTGDLYRGDQAVRNANDPMWFAKHHMLPPLAFFLAAGDGEPQARADLAAFAREVSPPATVTTYVSSTGGHWWRTWQAGMRASWSWLGEQIGGPLRVARTPVGVVTGPPGTHDHATTSRHRSQAGRAHSPAISRRQPTGHHPV
jgi:enterochelin esterase-like enzyme